MLLKGNARLLIQENYRKGVFDGGKVVGVVDTHGGKVKPVSKILPEKRDKYQLVKNENREMFGAKKVNTLYDPKKNKEKKVETPPKVHDIKSWNSIDKSERKKWQPFNNHKGEKMGIEKKYMPKDFMKNNLIQNQF